MTLICVVHSKKVLQKMRATIACVLCAPLAANANRIVRENLLPGSASCSFQ